MKVKTMLAIKLKELETDINEWLKDNKDKDIFDIKYQTGKSTYSAMIIYENKSYD